MVEPCFFVIFLCHSINSIVMVYILKRLGVICMAGCYQKLHRHYQALEHWYLTQCRHSKDDLNFFIIFNLLFCHNNRECLFSPQFTIATEIPMYKLIDDLGCPGCQIINLYVRRKATQSYLLVFLYFYNPDIGTC